VHVTAGTVMVDVVVAGLFFGGLGSGATSVAYPL
jgi:hypothetical protein